MHRAPAADRAIQLVGTPLGLMSIIANSDALMALEFEADALESKPNAITEQVARELAAFFRGELREFTTPLEPKGTDFQRLVWKALLEIPYGQTTTYGELAKTIGNPDAQRAVGAANGANPIAIIIPCHRVINSQGKLHGYGGGLWRKQKLLELESGQLAL